MKMQQWVTRLLALSSALALAGPLHAGNLLKALGVSTDTQATAYYNYIDNNNDRDTQAKFRCFNGFPNDVDTTCDPAKYPGNSVNTIVKVQGHKNISDLGSDAPGGAPSDYRTLGFWRRIDLVVDNRSGHQGDVAMSTFNFTTKAGCCDAANAASIVNMEYTRGPAGNRITKFYIYCGKNDPDPQCVPGAYNRKTHTFFDPQGLPPLGGAENLALPKGCASCHGGGKDYTMRGGSTGGGFLAFDFNVFDYADAAGSPAETQALNETKVKLLNQAVLMTNASDDVRAQIYGLYGGSGLPLATQNTAYRPSSWDTEPNLWTVVVKDCQGCHTWSEVDIRSLSYWKLLDSARNIRELIDTEKTMPNSPTGRNNLLNRNGGIDYTTIDQFLTAHGAPHQ
jgi:hypothetical protein